MWFVSTLRYKIREILIKNQKEKSREIFCDIHWIGHHAQISPAGVNQARRKRCSLERRGYEISRSIKKISKGIFKGDQQKAMWNFQRYWCFGLGVSKESNTILCSFQGWSFVLSGISRGKVEKKFQWFLQKYVLNPLFVYVSFFEVE